MGAYKRNVVVVIKMGSWGVYFVWVPIILILQYTYIHTYKHNLRLGPQ